MKCNKLEERMQIAFKKTLDQVFRFHKTLCFCKPEKLDVCRGKTFFHFFGLDA
jgi:hypothetical protein